MLSPYRQVELFELATGSRLTCWLPADERLKSGVKLTLFGVPRRVWVVLVAWKTVQQIDNIAGQWKVGGFMGAMPFKANS